jgi:phosphohistidine phosphatase
MIVGHLPHLARLASLLITGSETLEVAAFQQGGVVCLEHDRAGESWRIKWMLVPEILGRSA